MKDAQLLNVIYAVSPKLSSFSLRMREEKNSNKWHTVSKNLTLDHIPFSNYNNLLNAKILDEHKESCKKKKKMALATGGSCKSCIGDE